jgi:hypothetical protein
VRRDAFLTAEGFDAHSYRSAMVEDIELGMRLSDDGARIRLDPELRGSHLKRWTLRSMMHADLTKRGIPWVRMMISRRELSPALNLGWRHRLSALLYTTATATLIAQLFLVAAVLGLAAIALNVRFYALLTRRGGPLLGAAGVPLHCVHHLVATLSVALAVVAHVVSAPRIRGPARSAVGTGTEDEPVLARSAAEAAG